MRRVLAALILGAALVAPGCYTSRCEVPVDFEGIYGWVHYHGPACHHYPYSCPPCPYFDYANCTWRSPCPDPGATSTPPADQPASPAAAQPDKSVK